MLPRYKVRIENEPERCFDGPNALNAAMDYASRMVYIPVKDQDLCLMELRSGGTYRYSYGFQSAEIEATAKEIPKSVLEAAPEMLEALFQAERLLGQISTKTGMSFFSVGTLIRNAINKAEGRE